MIIELDWQSEDFKKAIRTQASRYGLQAQGGRVQIGIEAHGCEGLWEGLGRVLDGLVQSGMIEGAHNIDRLVIDRRESVRRDVCRVFIFPQYGEAHA